jgi:hypothetical protein
MPNPALAQTNPGFKKTTSLKYRDANFSPEEKRAYNPKYRCVKSDGGKLADGASAEESRGKKRARAEDFL